MENTVYIETSVVSYLTARPTNDLLASAWQRTTCQWWEEKRSFFSLLTSSLVREEASRGNPEAAGRRLDALHGIPDLRLCDEVVDLATLLLARGALPEKAADDAMHVAYAAYHGVDYLLTWNCRHIDNPSKKPVIRKICDKNGFVCPEICTPLELLEVE